MSQDGEDKFICKFFNNKKNGCLVDIGAADGIGGSNSYCLINTLGWKGLLVEPYSEYFNKLKQLYINNTMAICINCAVSDVDNKQSILYIGGRVSTIIRKFTERSELRKVDYSKTEIVNCYKLVTLLNKHMNHDIDFLSLDCEGSEIDALVSLHDFSYRINLICVEHSMKLDILEQTMKKLDYKLIFKTPGNSFFE